VRIIELEVREGHTWICIRVPVPPKRVVLAALILAICIIATRISLEPGIVKTILNILMSLATAPPLQPARHGGWHQALSPCPFVELCAEDLSSHPTQNRPWLL